MPSPLRTYISERLSSAGEEIVADWIELLKERVGTRTVASLPEQALRNHIPVVLQSIAEFLMVPAEAVRARTLGHLRLHAQLRHEQGYDIQELLIEFDFLTNLVFARTRGFLAEFADAEPGEVAEVFSLLSTGMRAVSFVTVGIYRERENDLGRDLSRRLQEVADTISHELSTPLNAIALGTTMLAKDEVASSAEDRQRYLGLVRESISRSKDLLESVRMLALSEGARTEERWQSLSGVAGKVTRQLHDYALEQGVRIEVGELPAADVDAVRVGLALLNLVGNGIKYRDAEKDEAWVRVEATWTEDEVAGCVVELKVEDNGVGIPGDLRAHVFQRHFRGHPELGEGLGLGLSLASRTLAQIGGTLELSETEVGVGTSFLLSVRARPEATPGTADRKRTNEIAQASIAVHLMEQEEQVLEGSDDALTSNEPDDEEAGE